MQTRRLGDHGLGVSELALGTLTWGTDTDEVEAAEILAAFLDAGGTTIDVPSDWGSRAFAGRTAAVGKALKSGSHAQQMVVVFHSGNVPEPPQLGGLASEFPFGPRTSKRNLLASLEQGLTNLGTDHVDLWVLHGPRQGVTVSEMIEAADGALRSGKATYVGIGGLDQWDMGAATHASGWGGAGGFVAIAEPFSLLKAGAATSVLPRAAEQGLGFLALQPLAQGVLTGKYRAATPPDSRGASPTFAPMMDGYFEGRAARVVEAVSRTANELKTTPSAVALAWVLAQPGVTNAVVGPRTAPQLEALLGAGKLRLQRELRDVLREVSLN